MRSTRQSAKRWVHNPLLNATNEGHKSLGRKQSEEKERKEMEQKKKAYIIEAEVGNYTIYGSGWTPKEALNCLWKEYRHHGWVAWWGGDVPPTKKEWLEWHGLDEDSCEEIEIGKSWYR